MRRPALGIFDRLGSRLDKADAYKVHRRGLPGDRPPRAGRVAAPLRGRAGGEHRLDPERGGGVPRAGPALPGAWAGTRRRCSCSNAAHRLFGRLDARVDLVDVSTKVAQLEETYFAVVREWGQSIESSDSYTFGHCERVAGYARGRGPGAGAGRGRSRPRSGSAPTCTTWARSGCRTRSSTSRARSPPEEFEVIRCTRSGASSCWRRCEFPWDIKPIIRWHHEKYDGTGLPRPAQGRRDPAQRADHLHRGRVRRAHHDPELSRRAVRRRRRWQRMEESRPWWRPDVYRAFQEAVL